MKTKIYKTKSEFEARSDKTENGVSEEFSKSNPEFDKQNAENEGCWNCSRCSDCYGCSGCSGCSRCSDCYGCSRCSDCYGCSRCSDCYGCSRCSGCSGCSRCSDCYGCSRCSDCYGCSRCSDKKEENQDAIKIPSVENIHGKVLEAVSKENAFDMKDWHQCETTHCRGGWVVHIAGEAGYKLEKQTSSEFAAVAIYNASSSIKVSPVRFYESNEVAMADIKRCAQLEKESHETKV